MDFLREVRLLSEMRHPRIVEIQSIFYAEPGGIGGRHGAWVMALSHCAGGTVVDFIDGELRNGPRRTEAQKRRAQRMICELCAGMKFCHDHVIHRDIKPNNLLLDDSGGLRVADFGHSRHLVDLHDSGGKETADLWHVRSVDDPQDSQLQNTLTKEVVTSYYKPPELVLGSENGDYGLAVDMWSVGCVIAELVSGKALMQTKSPGSQGNASLIRRIQDICGSITEANWPGHPHVDVSLQGGLVAAPAEEAEAANEARAPQGAAPPRL